METYRLNSKLVENNKEYFIKTANDVSMGAVHSEVYIDGQIADRIIMPHPEQINSEEILTLVQSTHEERKSEVETLLKAVSFTLDSNNFDAIFHLGLAFYYKRFYLEAVDLFQKAISLNNEYHQAYNMLGQAYLNSGNIEAALGAAQKAVQFKPEFADYRNHLGEAFLANKKYREAILEFDRAININLYYGDAYFNYALTLVINALEKNDTDLFKNFIMKAKDYFTKATLINTEYKSSLYDKGLAALEAKDLKTAWDLLSEVCLNKKERDRAKSAPFYMKYALHPKWITEKAISNRISFLKKEIEKNPTYVDLYAELARCDLLMAKMYWHKGINQYKKTLELNPSLAHIYKNLETTEKLYNQISQVIGNIEE